MISRPCFKPHVQVQSIDRDHLLFRSHDERIELSQPFLGLVAGAIDGARSTDEIVDELEAEVEPELVYWALYELERNGHLIEQPNSPADQEQSYWYCLGVDPGLALEKLARARVEVRAVGSSDPLRIEEALKNLGVARGSPADLVIVTTDHYLAPELDEVNRHALESGTPWMLFRPVGRLFWLGPVFIPGQTACWSCLARRLRKNGLGTRTPTAPLLQPAAEALTNLAAIEALKWIVLGRSPRLEGTLWTMDGAEFGIDRHPVVRHPDCAACGSNGNLGRSRLASCGKPAKASFRGLLEDPLHDPAGFRTCAPEETLRRLEGHISPITGIVGNLECRRANGLFVCAAKYAFGSGNEECAPWLEALGTGETEAQAKARCLGEAIERYSACWHSSRSVVRRSWRQIGEEAVSIERLLLLSRLQYEQPGEVSRLDDDAEIDWSQVWSLTHCRNRYVPSAFCYFGHPEGHKFCVADSVGCAAGDTLEEAVLRGFLELVERDAVALWWYNRVSRPAVLLPSFDEPAFCSFEQSLEKQGRVLHVLDLTTDLGVSAFAAVSVSPGEDSLALGFGAHLDTRVAISRALAELDQMLIKGSVPNRIEEHSYLLPGPYPRSTAGDFLPVQTSDLSQPLKTCVGIAQNNGLEVLALDLTQADVGFPVVRVIMPGLRPAWPRFAPGRLYDVPVKLGWIPTPLAEHELNPVALWL